MELSKTEKLCEICVIGNQVKNHLPKRRSKRSSKLLEIVQTDVCGPIHTSSTGGAKYFVIFTNDKSRWYEVHFIVEHSEALAAFKSKISLKSEFSSKNSVK